MLALKMIVENNILDNGVKIRMTIYCDIYAISKQLQEPTVSPCLWLENVVLS